MNILIFREQVYQLYKRLFYAGLDFSPQYVIVYYLINNHLCANKKP
jgi:hypothetical protein